MILEKNINMLSNIVSVVELQSEIKKDKYQDLERYISDQKNWRDLVSNFAFLTESAQNVLTPYQ